MIKREKNILVVDSDVTSRLYTKRLIRNFGFGKVTTTDDVSSALLELRLKKYDLIVSDWIMPDFSALDLLSSMRKLKQCRNALFMIVANVNEAGDVSKAFRRGVDCFVLKPFEPRILRQKLQNTLAQSSRSSVLSKRAGV